MSHRSGESNRQACESQSVVAHYAALGYLTACERLLFDSYIRPGSSILDLGVGGGRTTRYLASRASRYVGADYAESMVEACRERFHDLEFVIADASDLSGFSDACFDSVVIAFNGIDYVVPDELRRACLRQLHRLLKPNGFVIFSSHNPRAVLVRRGWNRTRLQEMARRYSVGSEFLHKALGAVLTAGHITLAAGQCVWRTSGRALKRVPSPAFWRGGGNLVDSAHGGLLTHCWVPRLVIAEMNDFGFRAERVLGDDYPLASRESATDWYYYVFAKR